MDSLNLMFHLLSSEYAERVRLVAEGVSKPLRLRNVGIERMDERHVTSQKVETFLYRDASVLVIGISVTVDHTEYRVHSCTG